MKRIMLIGLTLLITAAVVLTGCPIAIDPQNFTGVWYAAKTGEQFVFSEGIISPGKAPVQDRNQGTTGAYVFCRNHILLFTQKVRGVEEVKQLYLIRLPNGDVLYEKQNATDVIHFFRSRDEAILYKKRQHTDTVSFLPLGL